MEVGGPGAEIAIEHAREELLRAYEKIAEDIAEIVMMMMVMMAMMMMVVMMMMMMMMMVVVMMMMMMMQVV